MIPILTFFRFVSISTSGNSQAELSLCEVSYSLLSSLRIVMILLLLLLIIIIIIIIINIIIIIIIRWKCLLQHHRPSVPTSVHNQRCLKVFLWKNVNLIISHHHPHPHHQESVRVHGNVCILRNNQKMSWDQAKAFCAEVMMMMITLMMAVMVI